jgi:RNA polymerase sigma factor (sigma-70 family)
MTQSSIAFISRVRKCPDGENWQQFEARYARVIEAFVRAKLGRMNESELEDIVQEVKLQVWKDFKNGRYENRGRFRGWLSTVVKNKVTGAVRKAKKRLVDAQGGSDVLAQLQGVEDPIDCKQLLDVALDQEIAEIALAEVRTSVGAETKKWLAFSLTQFSEAGVQPLSIDDAARQLDIARGSVIVYRSQVLKQLKDAVTRLNAE